MSYSPIYPPLSETMSNNYQAISPAPESWSRTSIRYSAPVNTEEKELRIAEEARLAKEKKELRIAEEARLAEVYRVRVTERKKEKEEIERKKTFCEKNEQTIMMVLCITALIVIGLLALYIFSILLGTFIIVCNYVFENTMVALFGRAIYNKNFPICSNDIYQGSDCYTRTSTYCT